MEHHYCVTLTSREKHNSAYDRESQSVCVWRFFLEMNIIYLPLNMNKVGDVVSELQKIQQYYLFYVDIY